MTMGQIYWQEKGGDRRCGTRPLMARDCGDFLWSSPHFPHDWLDLNMRFPADHAGFFAWFMRGSATIFAGFWECRRLAARSAT